MSEFVRGLARYRVRLGFIAAVGALWLARPSAKSLAAGAAVAAVGEALRIWAAGHLEKGSEVTASGPYRLSRHPLYVGSAIIALGFAIASASGPAAMLVIAYLSLTYGAAIRSEEAHLTEKFGTAYPEYKEGRTGRAGRRFSVRRVVRNREYRAVAGLLLVLALLALKAL